MEWAYREYTINVHSTTGLTFFINDIIYNDFNVFGMKVWTPNAINLNFFNTHFIDFIFIPFWEKLFSILWQLIVENVTVYKSTRASASDTLSDSTRRFLGFFVEFYLSLRYIMCLC